MIKLISILAAILALTSCWPTRISFVDGSMPEEWKTFTVQSLDNRSSTAPSNYAFELTEALKDGIQNNTKLLLNPVEGAGEVSIEGSIISYNVSPIALQPGDVAAQNRLTVTVQFSFFISEPKEDLIELNLSKFADFDSQDNVSDVEEELIAVINEQIVQDVINKLMSNW